jgi:hypothetical protein
LGLGALFVLSAGLAREYDGADLYHEPWLLLIPFVASTGTSFLLYSLVYMAGLRRFIERPAFGRMYVSFLSLYWMTGPIAWFYAIPVERFMSAGNSTIANLYLLALVSLWRVMLITRVIHVLFGASIVAAFWLVMLFADSVALGTLLLTPIPIINVMGGVRLSASENAIQSAALLVFLFGGFSWLVWLLGGIVIGVSARRDWKVPSVEPMQSSRIGWVVWALPICVILVLFGLLPFTQPEQQLRHAVEDDLAKNRIEEAIQLMSKHAHDDFPPHWVPPPHLAYRDPRPKLLDVLKVVAETDSAAWVQKVFADKLESDVSNYSFGIRHRWAFDWDAVEKDRFLRVMERLPQGGAIVSRHADLFLEIAKSAGEDGELHARICSLLSKAGHEISDPSQSNGER